MAHYVATIPVPITRSAAFAYLSRFDRAAEWDPGVAEGSMLTPEPVGRGSRFALRAEFLGRTLPLEYEIIDFEPATRVVLRAETPLVRSIDTITFASEAAGSKADDATSGGTVVTYDARLEPKGLARVASPLLALAFRRIGDRAAGGLRKRLRADVAA